MLSKNLFLFLFLFFLLLFAVKPPALIAQWFPQVSPTKNDLKALAYQSNDTIFVCGAKGTLLKKTSARADWQTIKLNTLCDLNDMIFPDGQTGFLAGDSGAVFKTTNSGLSWQKLPPPTSQKLFSVFFLDSLRGWLAGQNGLILNTTNGGNSWQLSHRQENQTIHKIRFLSPSLGWAVGKDGLILKSIDGGASWQIQESGLSNNLYDLSLVDSSLILIAGADSLLLISADQGVSWKTQKLRTKGDLFTVQAVDSLTWWAGGSGTAHGLLIKTFTAGNLWKPVASSLLETIYDLKFSSLYHGYAVGKEGHIFYTETAGISRFPQLPLISPQKEAHGVSERPTFQWQADGDARAYQFQLASDAQFSFLLSDDSLYASTLHLPYALDFFTTYFWRVRSLTVLGPGLWSEVRSFRTVHSAPALIYPQNASYNLPLKPLLQWAPNGARYYHVEVARDTAFKYILFADTCRQAVLQASRLQYDNKYYWHVKSIYENEESGWSNSFSFTTLNGLKGWMPQFSGSNQLLKEVVSIDPQNGWAVGTAGVILKTCTGGADWLPCNSGTSYNLESVYFFDNQNGLACGWNGTVLKTENGGLSWLPVATPVSTALRSITFISDSVGWTVGERGTILKSTDRGNTWSVFSTNPNQEYYQICFLNNKRGWIVGGLWSGHDYSPLIMETKNGGQSWNTLPFSGSGILRTVFFISPDSGWTAGQRGQIFRTLNGGMSWLIQQGDKNYDIQSLFFQSPTKGWAVGDHGACLKTENSGQTWTPQNTGSNFTLADIIFTDAEHGWIVGGHGTILKTASAGLNMIPNLIEPQNHGLGLPLNLTLRWQAVEGASSYALQVADDSVFSHLVYENDHLATNELFLSGLYENRTYFWRVKSVHEGKTSDWSLPRNFLTKGAWLAQFSTTRQKLSDVVFENLYTGIAVGNGGTILRTTNGGDTWKQLPLITQANLNALCRTPADIYWAAGDSGLLLQSSDKGQYWQIHQLPIEATLRQITFLSKEDGWAGGIAVENQQNKAFLAHTNDRGENWQILYLDSLETLNTFLFIDSKHGLAAGKGKNCNLLRTDDGGRSWNVAKIALDSEIRSLFFTDAAHGYLVDDKGAFYSSTDGGYTWRLTNQLHSADDMFFADSVNGFILADGLYKTSDGGQNWQHYFADSSFSKIFFADQNTGWLLGANGLILKTTTAGSPLTFQRRNRALQPQKFELRQNFPNPFNPKTTIHYELPVSNHVELSIYNILGQKITTLISQKQPAGRYDVVWDASALASGVYICKLSTGHGFIKTKKLVLIK